MFMRSVSGVDNIGIDNFREKMRSPSRRMTDHDHIDLHHLKIPDGIFQRFTLADTACVG